jgi:glycosyltransferase involved in cell wall biosynthesis
MKSVCYIIPIFNNQAGLNRTLESIRRDAESVSRIYVCDDGSSTPVEINKGELADLVFLIRKEKNAGISAALNTLLMRAHADGYQYAALIDAGDIHRQGRIASQIDFFAFCVDAVVVGGDMMIVDLDGQVQGRFSPPISVKEIEKAFRRGYPFAHPTAMFDLEKLANLNIQYDETIVASVDYDFLYRIHLLNSRNVRNSKDLLVDYVRESESIGISRAGRQARVDSILGLMDIRLIIRATSPSLFFLLSKYKGKISTYMARKRAIRN